MTFTDKLRRLTEDRNKSRLARKGGLSPNSIRDYIHKGSNPSVKTAFAIAKSLSVDLNWLADDSRDWPPEHRNYPENNPTPNQ